MSAPVIFTSRPTARDVMGVAVRIFLRNGITILAMAAGPVFWLVGVTGGSPDVTRLGLSLMPLLAGVPAFGLLVGSYSAYRPGASELYAPAEWTFDDAGADVAHPGRRARVAWDEFLSWRFSGGCYLLYTARSRYLVLPARDIAADDRPRFEELLETHLGARRR